jgi:choline dehydrogenase-like flavoprotein
MPYIDFNKESITEVNDSFDYTIIGAGVAGILLALKLVEKKKSVLIIESGHFEEDEKRQILNQVEQTGKTVENAVNGRKRAVGGTSIAWGGQSLPFSKLDFEQRAWVKNSGWPIDFEDLKPYYSLANRFLNIDEFDYEDDVFKRINYKKIIFKEDHFYQHFSKWAPKPNLKKLYNESLKKNVTIIYNAVLTKIDLDIEGKAQKILITNYDNKHVYIQVNRLLLATGGIETNRILLANNHQIKEGIGNHSGWLGKCFMEHPCIEIGTLSHPNIYKLQSVFNTHVYDKRKYSIRISLTALAQQKYNLVNGSVLIDFNRYKTDADNPYIQLINLKDFRYLIHFKKIVKHWKSYFLSIKAFFKDKFVYKHKSSPTISLMMEQEPMQNSFIELSEQKDAFGVPKAKINWAISFKTWESVNAITQFLKAEFKRLSLADISIHPHVVLDNDNWETYLTDVNHHMGGTRISETPERGVVDKNLKIWGHDNIYICSSSVFPTGSHSNPTLTIMALGLRLVDHLEKDKSN